MDEERNEAKSATSTDLKRSRKEARKWRRREKRSLRRGGRSSLRRRLYGRCYRATMRLAHRYNWHRARVLGPMQPESEDGRDWLRRCDWCGFSQRFNANPRLPLSKATNHQPTESEEASE